MESVAKTSVFAMVKFCRIVALALCFTYGALSHADTVGDGIWVHEQPAKSEAWDVAHAYSRGDGDVGIVIVYGTSVDVSATDLGEAYIAAIAKRDAEAQYVYYHTPEEGVAVSFHFGDQVAGPWDTARAAQELDRVVAAAKREQRILSIEARMEMTRAELVEKYGEKYVEAMADRWLLEGQR